MKVKILGTRGEINLSDKKHYKHSGILIDDKILIDIGESEYLDLHPKIIFITHLHPDHAFFISEKQLIHIPVDVYGSESSPRLKKLKVLNEAIKFEDYKVIPIPTTHTFKLKSQGYIIEKDSLRIFYTGDLISIDKKYHSKLKNLNLVITEGSFIRKGGLVRKQISTGEPYGHAGIPDLIDFFKPYTKRIIFTHFGSWFMKNVQQAKDKIKNYQTDDLIVEAAYDGMEIRI